MAATIKDVAKRAGVSIATVSKMLNGGNVLSENREAIEQAINELNYRVNTVARGMKTRRTMTVGVLIPSLADYYGLSVLSHIDRTLFENGYSTIICDYDENDSEGASKKLELLLNKQVDGIVMQPINVRKRDLSQVVAQGTPLVFIDVGVSGSAYDSVVIDNTEISKKITSMCIKKGHHDVGILVGAPGVSTTEDRISGYMSAHKKFGIMPREELIYKVDISEKRGYQGMKYLLELPKRPTAVFTAGHDLTVGALAYLNEVGMSIPRDISFVGFETQTISRIYHPKLTIGIQPVEQIGQTAALMLIERMREEYNGVARKIKLSAVVDVGASVVAPLT